MSILFDDDDEDEYDDKGSRGRRVVGY